MISTEPRAEIIIKANISILDATPKAATASLPNAATILVISPIDIGVISNASPAGPPMYKTSLHVLRISFNLPVFKTSRFSRRIRINKIKISPEPLAITVARAAPLMPISGKGPMPKISNGSSITFITADITINIPGVNVSPVARTILFPIIGTTTKATP